MDTNEDVAFQEPFVARWSEGDGKPLQHSRINSTFSLVLGIIAEQDLAPAFLVQSCMEVRVKNK